MGAMAPTVPIIAIPAFIFPDRACVLLIGLLNQYIGPKYRAALAMGNRDNRDNGNDNPNVNPDTTTNTDLERFLIPFIVKSCASQGLHLYLWLSLNIYLLFYAVPVELWTWGGMLRGCFYLYLSELFLYGFCMHPYMGYVSHIYIYMCLLIYTI